MAWEIRINLGEIWDATKSAAKTVKDKAVAVGNAIVNPDEEKIELLMRSKNVDRPAAIKLLKEYREAQDKDSVKTTTLDNLKR